MLFWLLLWVGWFIWLAFTAPRGRSPAKSITSQYVIDIETGRAAGGGEMWLREFALKGLGLSFIANIFPIIILVDAFWIFFDRDRKALHDIALKQTVVYAPRGLPEAMKHMAGAPKVAQMEYVWPWTTAMTPKPVPVKVQDVGEDLRELNRLRSEGLITDAEFEQKRQAFISRM